MEKIKKEKFTTLRHYTNLGCLKSILGNNQLKFSNGINKGYEAGKDAWDDQNDVMVLNLYKERNNGCIPFVICFTHSISIHHWEYYGNSGNGKGIDKTKCCIVFDYAKMKKLIKQKSNNNYNMKFDMVKYYSVKAFKNNSLKIKENEIPFIKKYGFNVDKEERLVLFSNNTNSEHFLDGINDCIKSIVIYTKNRDKMFSYDNIKTSLLNKYKFIKNKQIMKSALCDSKEWQKEIQNKLKN